MAVNNGSREKVEQADVLEVVFALELVGKFRGP